MSEQTQLPPLPVVGPLDFKEREQFFRVQRNVNTALEYLGTALLQIPGSDVSTNPKVQALQAHLSRVRNLLSEVNLEY